ncbi:hypothetical protein N9E48_10230 [Paracoccaceae bacterium]|nr:hypothetical protein [Paracoccaceae bacterium]
MLKGCHMQGALSNYSEERLNHFLSKMNLSTTGPRAEKELLIRGLISRQDEECKQMVKLGRPKVEISIDELRAKKVLSACKSLVKMGYLDITQKTTIEYLQQIEAFLFELGLQGSEDTKKLFTVSMPRLQQSVSTGLKRLGFDFGDFRKSL